VAGVRLDPPAIAAATAGSASVIGSCDSGYLTVMNLAELLGIAVERSDADTATATMVAGERHLNPGGTVHGGALAALVDVAMGAAVNAGNDDDERAVTIEMKVNYLEAGEAGPLQATSIVRRRGSRFTVLEAEVLQGDQTLVFATGTFSTVPR
jgi:uncharacterized protein (TIGR00369 family)